MGLRTLHVVIITDLALLAFPVHAQFLQQGSKLTASDAVNTAAGVMQGSAVALSGDGNTLLVGGWNDNGYVGAAWVYTNNNGVWTQQGPKLVGTGATGVAVTCNDATPSPAALTAATSK